MKDAHVCGIYIIPTLFSVFVICPTAAQCARRLNSINIQTPENEDLARVVYFVTCQLPPIKKVFTLMVLYTKEEQPSLAANKTPLPTLRSFIYHRIIS